MKKRVLSVLLAFALVVGSLPAQVFATDESDAAAQQVTTVTQVEESDTQDTQSNTQNAEGGMQDTDSDTQDVEDGMQDAESGTQNAEDDMQASESNTQNTESGMQDAESNAQDVEDDTQGVQNNINIQDDRQSNGLNNVQEDPQNDLQPAVLNAGSFTYLDEDGVVKNYEGEYTLVTEESCDEKDFSEKSRSELVGLSPNFERYVELFLRRKSKNGVGTNEMGNARFWEIWHTFLEKCKI